jgi:hypothetical protein
VEDRAAQGLDAQGILVETHQVTPGYFDLLGIDLVAGRDFAATDRDVQRSQAVAIVNRTFATRFWPGENAVGRRFRLSNAANAVPIEIIGIADEVLNEGRTTAARPSELEIYLSLYQVPARLPPQLNLIVRTSAEPLSVAAALRTRARAAAADVPLFDVRTMEQRLDEQAAGPRFLALLLALFAAVSLVLAAVGIYGLMAYRVARQRRELGLRLALGALPADLLVMVLRRATLLALTGIAVGAISARVLARFLESALNGVSPGDPLSFAVAAACMLIVVVLSSLPPAFRAARAAPMRSMAGD